MCVPLLNKRFHDIRIYYIYVCIYIYYRCRTDVFHVLSGSNNRQTRWKSKRRVVTLKREFRTVLIRFPRMFHRQIAETVRRKFEITSCSVLTVCIEHKVRHNVAIAVYLVARNTYVKPLISRVRDKIPDCFPPRSTPAGTVTG